MAEAEAIAEALTPHLPLMLGSLCVWGDWFGRPLDNLHVAVAARHAGDELLIEFTERDVLTVRQPEKWRLEPDAPFRQPRLLIRRAMRVDWGWYLYGRPQTPDNWFLWQHWREGGQIMSSSTWAPFAPTLAPSAAEPAVMFI